MAENSVNTSENDIEVSQHRVRFIEPDVIYISWNGPCTRADFSQILAHGGRWTKEQRHFVLADMSKLTSMDAEVRKYMAEEPRILRVVGLAVIGATFHMRVLLGLVTKAVDYIQKKQNGLTRFFATEAEALAWIASERERLGLPTSPNPER